MSNTLSASPPNLIDFSQARDNKLSGVADNTQSQILSTLREASFKGYFLGQNEYRELNFNYEKIKFKLFMDSVLSGQISPDTFAQLNEGFYFWFDVLMNEKMYVESTSNYHVMLDTDYPMKSYMIVAIEKLLEKASNMDQLMSLYIFLFDKCIDYIDYEGNTLLWHYMKTKNISFKKLQLGLREKIYLSNDKSLDWWQNIYDNVSNQKIRKFIQSVMNSMLRQRAQKNRKVLYMKDYR